MQTCLFASDQTYPAWDWIQVSYSSAFNFGSRRATFAMNCNLAIHGSEVYCFFPCFAQRVLCSMYMRAQGTKPCSEFMAALPFNVCLRHNEGAEIPFYGRMLRLFYPCLTPSDHPLHPISPYRPDSYFGHFFPILSLFKPLVSHCHRPVTMFLSQAPLQPCWLSPGLSDPGSVAAQAIPCTSSQTSHLHHTSSPASVASLAQCAPPSRPSPPSSYPIRSPPGLPWVQQSESTDRTESL